MKASSGTVLEERREFRSARPRICRKVDRLGREPELSHFCHPLPTSMTPAAVSRSKVALWLFSRWSAVTPQIASAIHRNGSALDRQSYRYGTPPLSAKVSKGGAVPASLRVLQAEQLTLIVHGCVVLGGARPRKSPFGVGRCVLVSTFRFHRKGHLRDAG